jgi:hypothetical protein
MYSILQYFGVSVQGDEPASEIFGYQDIEKFIMKVTTFKHTPRTLEGFLAWLNQYGHLISPSKIRRLVKNGEIYKSSFLGAICDLLERKHQVKFKIVRELCEKEKFPTTLTPMPISLIRSRNPVFEDWGLVVTEYECKAEKFLIPEKHLLKNCLELRNRIVMGSVTNSDICSLLLKHKSPEDLTMYQISKLTNHQKTSVTRALKIRFLDILKAS